ncbi:MAG: DUF1648 domain-containing protein [Lachnospiraceae bacterium]|nr:DUF1648 domain-containing protein [Lachnospiraceae bacterium]
MKKIISILALLPFMATMFVLQFMPDEVPLHYDKLGQVDKWGSKYHNLLFPSCILIFYVIWLLIIAYYNHVADNAADENERIVYLANNVIITRVALGFVIIFNIFQYFILRNARIMAIKEVQEFKNDIYKTVFLVLSIILIIAGMIIKEIKNKGVVGFKTNYAEYNETTLKKSNHFAGSALITAGIVTVIAVIFFKWLLIPVLLLGIAIAIGVSYLYSYIIYRKEV